VTAVFSVRAAFVKAEVHLPRTALLKHLNNIRKVKDRVIKQQASDGKKPVPPRA
jgi:hypothetical protein